jgi:hypothetical protein
MAHHRHGTLTHARHRRFPDRSPAGHRQLQHTATVGRHRHPDATSPINNTTTATVRPTLRVTNGTVTGDVGRWIYPRP